MFHKTRLASFALLVCLLAAPAFAQPLADRIPDDAMLYIGWQGSKNLGSEYQQSHLKSILDDSGFRELFGPFRERLLAKLAQINPNEDEIAQVKFVSDLINLVWQNQWAIYVGKVVPPSETTPPIIHVAFMIELGDQAEPTKQKLAGLIPPQAPIQLNVVNGTLCAVFGDLDAMYPNLVKLLNGKADGKSIKTNKKFTAAMGKVQKNPVSAIYVDLTRIVRLVDQVIGMQVKQAEEQQRPLPPALALWPKIRDQLALTQIQSFTAAAGFVEKDWGCSAFLAAPSPRKGLAALMDGKPLSNDVLKMIPSTAAMAGAGYFDLQAFAKTLINAAVEFEPKLKPQIEKGLADITEQFGIHPIDDLLGSFGPEWVYYTDKNVAGAGALGTVIVNNLRDAEKMQKSIATLTTVANAIVQAQLRNEEITITIRQSKINGKTVYHLGIPYISPSIVIDNNKLYLGLYPQVVVAAVERANLPDPGFGANPKYKALRKWAGTAKVQSFSFVDTKQTIPINYQSWMMAGQLTGFADVFGIKSPPMLLPPLNRLQQQLSPSGSFSWSDDQGFYMRSRSPFPGASLAGGDMRATSGLAVPAVMAGILLPALGRAREIANRSVSGANMRAIFQSCYVYSVTNKDEFPDDLGVIIMDGSINCKSVINPSTSTGIPERLRREPLSNGKIAKWAVANTSYLYYPGIGANSPADAIILMDKPMNHRGDGISICFGDGHVEWVTPQRASRAIQRHNELAKEHKGMQTIKDPFAAMPAHRR